MTSPYTDRSPSSFAGGEPQADDSFANGGGMQGAFYTVNADITSVSAVSYNGNASTSIDGKVSISFIYTGPTTTSGGAKIQYGLLIAAPGDVADQGKGMTDGANAWTGGSLQTTVEINGSGATSIQLAPSAIIPGEISGTKFNDINGDGLRDTDGADNVVGTEDDETGLANWKIFIDLNGDGLWNEGEAYAITDATGRYVLSFTPDADRSDPDNDPYIVREVQQTGWMQTTANPAPILISSLTPNQLNVDFGNMLLKPSLQIMKEAAVDGGSADYAGEVIGYTIYVSNTGNQTLTGVSVTDPFISNLTLINDAASADGQLNVGETWTYTGTHTVTQAEIDAGQNILNIATADSDQTEPDSDDASVPVDQKPSLAIDKAILSVSGGNGNGSVDAVNDVISYAVTVSNTGNQTLNEVSVNDPLTGLSITGVTLAPGASQTYLTSYTLTQADLDSFGGGGVFDVAVATADSLQTAPVSGTEKIELFVRAALSIDKKLVSITEGNLNGVADAAGDQLNYTVTISNLGILTLTNVSVVDASSGLNINGLTLAPGQSQVFETSCVLTQADLDNNGGGDGKLDNTSVADSDQTEPVSDTETVQLLAKPILFLNKSFVNVTGGNGNNLVDAVGDQLNYQILLANPGNVTLTEVSLIESLTGLSNMDMTLAPGAVQVYNVSYTLTQANLDNNGGGDGYVDSTVTADSAQTSDTSDSESVPLLRKIGMSFDKEFEGVSGGNGNDLADFAGDVLNYSFTITNLGNITLTNLNVVDDLTGLNQTLVSLAPGATQIYNASYILTQSDLDSDGGGNRQIENYATADTDQTEPLTDFEGVTVIYDAQIDLTKYVSVDQGTTWLDANIPTGPALPQASDINPVFKYTALNNGTVTLKNVTLTDEAYDLNGIADGDEWLWGDLAPGQLVEYIFEAPFALGQNSGDAQVTATTAYAPVLDIDNAYYLGV